MEPTEITMLIAFGGAMLQFVIGFWQKKVNNPELEFQPEFITIAIIGALMAAVSMQNIEVVSIDIQTIFGAILMGMGGTAMTEKMRNKVVGKTK